MTTTSTLATGRTTVLGTGIRMHHVDHGDPQGQPLVMIHGYSDSSHSFSRLVPLLDAGFRVHAVDLRGHGDSDSPAEGYDMDTLATDLVAFLDAAGIARASLLGHSLGTSVARRVAEIAPHRVERLAMIGAMRTPINDAAKGLAEAVQAVDAESVAGFAREFQDSTVHKATPADFYAKVVEVSAGLPLHVWRAVADAIVAFDDSADLGRITAPTLLMWGAHDSYFGRPEQEWLAGRIPSVRLVEYADSGHNPHWEEPEEVARDLQAFLSGDQR